MRSPLQPFVQAWKFRAVFLLTGCIFWAPSLLADETAAAPKPPAATQAEPKAAPKTDPKPVTPAAKAADGNKVEKPASDTPAAPQGPAPGHSAHGEAFNEGPRQAAYLMGNTGRVNITITTRSADAQAFFNQGLGQLQGYWYFEAERSFRQAAMLDPDCAMNYWGMSQANINNLDRAVKLIAEAVKRKDKASEHEKMYIDAWAKYVSPEARKDDKRRRRGYIRDLEAILHKFPDDLEARTFYASHLWLDATRGGIPIQNHQAVDALIQQVLDVEPMHPIHHFRIHLWDDEKPERALTAAAKLGPSAPGIAHQWHMPGHIYSKMRRYADAAWQQEASARVDHAQMMRDRVLPDQIHNFAHNNEWLTRDLMNIGSARRAMELAKNMIELPRHPKINTLDKRGSFAYGRDRLFDVLNRFELWDQAVELCNNGYLEPTERAGEQLRRMRLLGKAFTMRKDASAGQAVVEELEKTLAAVKADKKRAGEAGGLEGAIAEIKGYLQFASGDAKGALETLKKARDVDQGFMARVHMKAGEVDQALKIAKRQVDGGAGTVLPLALQAYLLQEAGKKDEAAKAFEKLRENSQDIDLEAPPFARLGDLARELGQKADWRMARAIPADRGERPSLDSLGPFRWQPMAAPDWSLPDDQGKLVKLSDYRGRNVVLVFYLGFGCLHCVEQLNAFAPLTGQFKDAGLEIVAVSMDELKNLQESVKSFRAEGTYPFKLISNKGLDVFKAYRAYDDFEKTPLHGTFLIDAQGKVRWQDISYEPFTEVKFLLDESKRLLAQPVGGKG